MKLVETKQVPKNEFELNGHKYITGGIGRETFLEYQGIARQLDKKFGKGESKKLMKFQFDTESSIDLDNEQARVLIVMMKKQIELLED